MANVIFQVAEGGEMTTIDGTHVNFITNNEVGIASLVESSGNAYAKPKSTEITEPMQEVEDDIVIQTVDGKETQDINQVRIVWYYWAQITKLNGVFVHGITHVRISCADF